MIPNKATIVVEEEDEIMDEIDDSDLDAFIPKEAVQDKGDEVVAEEEEQEDTDEGEILKMRRWMKIIQRKLK